MGKKHSRCNYNTKIFCLKKRCHEITCFCKAALVLLVCCLNTLISFSMSGNAMNLLRKREKLFNNLLKGFTKSRWKKKLFVLIDITVSSWRYLDLLCKVVPNEFMHFSNLFLEYTIFNFLIYISDHIHVLCKFLNINVLPIIISIKFWEEKKSH